jgi:glutaredoxin 3
MNIVYTKPDCPWCDKAKALLDSYDIQYATLTLGQDFSREYLQKMLPEGSKVTVPQVILNGKRIGGYEELIAYFEQTGIFGLQN